MTNFARPLPVGTLLKKRFLHLPLPYRSERLGEVLCPHCWLKKEKPHFRVRQSLINPSRAIEQLVFDSSCIHCRFLPPPPRKRVQKKQIINPNSEKFKFRALSIDSATRIEKVSELEITVQEAVAVAKDPVRIQESEASFYSTS
ncbi:hypothetical protein CDL15_Pgr012495 [Punica granatum]|uniref:Uncharacterized protein n=1 Tax=Punica granatum TaxID=22663 RepID=A0A218WVP1_PUNGR|nr:hypothetical protein CDL15_Pgr012495 [Punica granatum]